MVTSMTIAEAKQRLKIPDLWRILDLPGDCSKNPCHSPFYERTSKPSFSVSVGGDLFNDFRTSQAGDQIVFLQFATGLSLKEAIRIFIELAGGGQSDPLPVIQRAATPPQARELPALPTMRLGTRRELEVLAALRKISVQACQLADFAGFLRFGEWKGRAAWFITEPGGRNTQARRMDGRPWEEIGAKAQTLPGCWASWPIGVGAWDDLQADTLLMVEGAPDLLAACHYIEKMDSACFPVAMLGAGQRIHPDALPLFAGKRIRICAHADKPGRDGAERWAAQLATVGAEVDIADFSGLRKRDGAPVKDLNDTTEIHPDDAGQLEGLLPE